MKEHNIIQVGGYCTLRAWKPGIIQPLLDAGFPLIKAQERALRLDALRHEDTVHNLVVTVGKRLVGDILIDVEAVGLTYHSVGTSNATPTVNDVGLNSEYFRKAITSRTRPGTATYFTLSTFYVANQVTINIQECGIFGGHYATSTLGTGTMFAHWLQAYDNTVVQNDLTFDYVVDVLS